jgi:hypothetical protein
MKQLLLLIFLCARLHAAAQKDTRYYDSLIRKALSRFVAHPDCDVCDTAGIALLKVFKSKDSVYVKLLYASEPIYNIETDRSITKWLNKKYKDSFENKYKVLVPLYFQYSTEKRDPLPVSNDQKAALKKQIKKQGRKIHTAEPLTIIGYGAIR